MTTAELDPPRDPAAMFPDLDRWLASSRPMPIDDADPPDPTPPAPEPPPTG